MKYKSIYIIAIIAIISIIILSFIRNNEKKSIENKETYEIIFSSKFLKIAGQTPENWAKALQETQNVEYIEIDTDEENETVMLKITKEQKNYG